MYTMDCTDPDCIKCKQAPKGQSSRDENHCRIPDSVEQSVEEEIQNKLLKMVKENLFSAAIARRNCLSNCRKLKEEVHHKIGALINILKERELDLCLEIEREYSAQLEKIDKNITLNCVDKIMKRDNGNKPFQTPLIFNSDFNALKKRLVYFGQLKYDEAKELTETFRTCNQLQAGTEDASVCSSEAIKFEKIAETVKKEEITNQSYFSEDKKCKEDNSLKIFEVLTNKAIKDPKQEEMAYQSFESAHSVPNKVEIDKSLLQGENEPLSPELKLQMDFKELWAKIDLAILKRRSRKSQSSNSTDSLSCEEVEKDSSLDEDDIEIISRQEAETFPSDLSFSPPLPPKNRFKFNGKKPSCLSFLQKKVPSHSLKNSTKSESSGIGESESQESSLSSITSGDYTEVKENESFNEEPSATSSKDVGKDNNPTVALRSSFTKYLEKNPEYEWLAPVKSSEQSEPAENNCKERIVPIFVQEMDQWLPTEYNQNLTSLWLHPAHK